MKCCRLFCVSSPRRVTCSPWQDYRSFCTISLWRVTGPPWRNPGSDLNNSPGEQTPAMAKFFSSEPSFRHECSPSIRHGEFMQNGPCFAKIIKSS
ncbi:hypothetical protein P8452_37875 [Trifolium repens]|nr:hypothetical protein P8452_37875 [Trifolium repens]